MLIHDEMNPVDLFLAREKHFSSTQSIISPQTKVVIVVGFHYVSTTQRLRDYGLVLYIFSKLFSCSFLFCCHCYY